MSDKASKEVYQAWQARVITEFFEAGNRVTPIVPVDGTSSVLRKVKAILVVDMNEGADCMSSLVAVKAPGLPSKTHLQLWHVGKQARDGVSFGMADGVFKHPACDVGGLTNYRQSLGAPADFATSFGQWPVGGENSSKAADRMYGAWGQETGRIPPASFKAELAKWLDSLSDALGSGSASLQLYKVPPEHRVIATCNDVRARTGGVYYTRKYGAGDDHYADVHKGNDLFCAVAAKFVTPNINLNNIEMEYEPYPARKRERPPESNE